MVENDPKWTNSPEFVPSLQPRRKYSLKLAAALRAGRSIVGVSQAAFARRLGISKSKLARAETAAGAISSEDLEFALRWFEASGVKIDLSMDKDLTITVPNSGLATLDELMKQESGQVTGASEYADGGAGSAEGSRRGPRSRDI